MTKIAYSIKFKWLAIVLCSLVCCFNAFSQTGFDPAGFQKTPPGVQTLVTDKTGTLTPEQLNALEEKLVRFDDSSSTQVAVIIIPTTGGAGISEYNQGLGRSWGVGDKRFNNGVILLIAKDDRKLDIASGYGLEGALTDYAAQHIIDDIIVPNFKGNDYYRGIDEGVDAIIATVQGKYNAPRERSGGGISAGRIILIIVIVIIFLSIFGGNDKGGTFMSRRGSRGLNGPIFWPTGGWSGGSSGGGGWSGGGGGGGGFGGFGGGSFGGGGASGSW